ncbi:MAG: hypothetical protein F4Y42_00415 [Caldilineaceae bacterium SB0664_bin_27]|uniref:DUF5615 domain-containing protein n=1 Tax=Caldilineaceae bacterium SB0664_bin_27 TaxID=2605260 RepID=A0A6B0YNX1_9CHLR|nr:hypothetical protein [Caldilineaceae bacterium SB0664_bin_27]
MARLYADEDFPFPVVEELRSLGHDVLTIQEDGKANRGIPDEDVLSAARTYIRAVLTMNHRDFVRLHMESSVHSGIVTCTYDLEFERQARRVHETIEQYETLEGELIRVIRGAP